MGIVVRLSASNVLNRNVWFSIESNSGKIFLKTLNGLTGVPAASGTANYTGTVENVNSAVQQIVYQRDPYFSGTDQIILKGDGYGDDTFSGKLFSSEVSICPNILLGTSLIFCHFDFLVL